MYCSKTDAARPPRVLVLVKGRERYLYRFSRGSEGALLAALLETVRDQRTNLAWADLLPVLVRLRDYILGAGNSPFVVHKIHAAA